VWLLHGVPLSPQVWDQVRPHLGGEAAVRDLNAAIESVPRDGVLQRRIAVKVLADLPAGELVVVGHSLGGRAGAGFACAATRSMSGGRLNPPAMRSPAIPTTRVSADSLIVAFSTRSQMSATRC